MTRVVLGFAVAALWLPVLLYFTAGDYGAFWLFMTASFTVPLTLFVAVPLYYFWRRRITFWRCILAGFAIGAIGALAFLAMTHPEAALNWSPGLIGSGVVTSLVFWFIAVWKNGDLGRSAESGATDAAI
jgi:putative effector of murein hydrolase